MSENQKLREVLHKAKAALSLALSDVDWRKDSLTQPVIHKAYNCAHEALALPTAAPVGEREAFEKWILDATGYIGASVKRDQEGQYKSDITESAWDAWQARAAMSAGDAVDAQRYRWLADCNNYEAGLALIIDPKLTEQALDAAIDAAMRKDKP